MNKRDHRRIGVLSSEESMENLIHDLENANSMSSSQNTGFNTLSQPFIYSKSNIKKPLVEKNKKLEYGNNTHITFTNSDKLFSKNQSQVKRIINI